MLKLKLWHRITRFTYQPTSVTASLQMKDLYHTYGILPENGAAIYLQICLGKYNKGLLALCLSIHHLGI